MPLNNLKRFKKKLVPVPESGCWIWIGSTDRNGYGLSRFKNKRYRAHRLSYLFQIGEIPDGMLVLHKCDVPSCCNPNHLFLGDQSDNARDMSRKGRCALQKLSDRDKEGIKEMSKNGYLQREICDCFDICRTTVRRVVMEKR